MSDNRRQWASSLLALIGGVAMVGGATDVATVVMLMAIWVELVDRDTK